jgi:hypothetical protein
MGILPAAILGYSETYCSYTSVLRRVVLLKSRGDRITMASVSSNISKLKGTLKIIFKI